MARSLDRPAEGGFTMVELVVSLALISTMMGALSAYFVASTKTSRYQSQIQVATRIAQTGMEAARGYGGPTLLVGRAKCGSCVSVVGYNATYLNDTVRYDAAITGVTPTVPLPSSPDAIKVGGIYYYRYFLLGRCYQAATGGICSTNTLLPVAMVRLTVGILWSAAECPGSSCVRAASALFSADPADPVFTQ